MHALDGTLTKLQKHRAQPPLTLRTCSPLWWYVLTFSSCYAALIRRTKTKLRCQCLSAIKHAQTHVRTISSTFTIITSL